MNVNSHRKIALALTTAAFLIGCQSGPKAEKDNWKFSDTFDLDKGMPWHKDDEPKKGTPVRFVDSWTDTVLHRPGDPSQRGFGGRIHFYDADSGNPILVDGQLVVYAFDETDRDPTDNRPTKRYVFPPEELMRHMSESKLGPSYSVWLPWDDAGGESKEVSLICRFEPRGGTLIVGEQAHQRLPGTMIASKLPTSIPPDQNGHSGVQQAVYNGSDGTCNTTASFATAVSAGATTTAPDQPAAKQMTTTSISLPPQFRKR